MNYQAKYKKIVKEYTKAIRKYRQHTTRKNEVAMKQAEKNFNALNAEILIQLIKQNENMLAKIR